MQDIKSRELREKNSNANTKIYFEVRTIALRPCLHTEGFQLSTKDLLKKNLHRGITSSINKEYTTPTLAPLHKREGTQPSTKQRKLQLSEHLDRKQKLNDPMITNKISHNTITLKDRFAMNSSSS